MHHELDAFPGHEISTQVCIIGAGVAGITMARRLLGRGIEVLLLESGGVDYDADTAALNEGESSGLPYYDLQQARLRFFGGTTAIWGGRCAELDPIDFERRAWVPHSGWPLTWEELQPYYREARQMLGLGATALGVGDLAAMGVQMPDFDMDRIGPRLWSFDEKPARFAFENCKDLVDHPRCRIITQATVREICAAWNGQRVDYLDVQSLSGRRISVTARHYVLATGGIENARLLLASRSVMPMGLGNGRDWVGRCFMEHPHGRGGRVVTRRSWMLLNAYARRHRIGDQFVAALLTPGETLQREQGLLNTSLTIVGRRPPDGRESYAMRAYGKLKHDMRPDRKGRALWMSTKRVVNRLLRYTEPARPWLLNKLGRLDLALLVRAEQAPNRESRVMLSELRDPLGVPITKLHWTTSELDTHSVSGLVGALGGELDRLGIGEVEPEPWLAGETWRFDPLVSAHPIGGYHHMGTTRMAQSPSSGVTDGHGRVHGVANLMVAGSSLFPTSGWANPTLTIMALACRSADAILKDIERAPQGLAQGTGKATAPPRLGVKAIAGE